RGTRTSASKRANRCRGCLKSVATCPSGAPLTRFSWWLSAAWKGSGKARYGICHCGEGVSRCSTVDQASFALEPTPNSLRSCVAPAIGRGSPQALDAEPPKRKTTSKPRRQSVESHHRKKWRCEKREMISSISVEIYTIKETSLQDATLNGGRVRWSQ